MKPTKQDILKIVKESFDEEISTSIGYVGPDMPTAHIEGKENFISAVEKKLYKYFPTPDGLFNGGGVIEKLNTKVSFKDLFTK